MLPARRSRLQAVVRPAFLVASLGAHTAAFVAAGNVGAPSPGAAGALGATSADDPVDVSPEPSRYAAAEPTPRPPSTFARSQTVTPPRGDVKFDARSGDRARGQPITARSPRQALVQPALQAVAKEPHGLATTAPPRFTLVTTSEGAAGSSTAIKAGAEESGNDSPLPEQAVSSPARLTSPVSPDYPTEARAREVEADVVLAIVVTPTGDVADARVIKAAGFGFDEAALHALRSARFAPAQRDGRRVAVRMGWTVSFRLR